MIPKFSTQRLAEAFERARDQNGRLASDVVRASPWKLHYKTNAYNWLAFSLDEPPCFGPDGAPVPQSKVKQVAFVDESSRDIALLLCNGKLMYVWWRVVGGDLDLTSMDVRDVSAEHSKSLGVGTWPAPRDLT